jgi:outer membrane protein
MNKCYLLLIVLTISVPIYAQQQQQDSTKGVRTFTLDQAIQFALENNNDVENAAIDEKIALARVKETRGIGLPQVDAAVGVRHNQKLPRFFANYQTAQGFSGTNPDTGEPNLQIEGAQPSDIVASPNFFQLKSAGDAGVTISQLIFNTSYLVGLQAAHAYKDLAIKSSDRTKEEVVANVAKAYYACLVNNDRIGLFEANIARVDSLLKTTTALFENGFAESIDVDRIRVTLNNLKTERSNFLRLQDIGYEMLKFQMNYPMNQEITVEGDLSKLTVDASALDEYSLNWDYSIRTDYRLLEANQRLQELNLKNKYAESLPSLAAFANLGYQTQSPDFAGVFKTESAIAETPFYGPDKWYSYSNFGLSLNIPIFSGLQRTYRVQQAKLALQKTDNDFEKLRSGIDMEIKTAANTFLSAVETAKSQRENQQLSEKIARTTRIKFEQGVGSNLEVVEAESDLRAAQINYYNALYEAIVAKINLEKAYGKLVTPTETGKK